MPIKVGVETQTPLPLSLATRDHARAALARAFEEAAVMPGTLLPHEILAELRDVAPEESLHELGTGLFLQDIGKLALPPSLVYHPGPLAPDEWELMMQHTLRGLEFLRDDTFSAPAKSVVRSHHERWNGSGYPGGLIGEEASLFARIAAVADVFDAVTSERFHAHALPRDEGIELIRAGSGSAFDPTVVAAFLDVAGR